MLQKCVFESWKSTCSVFSKNKGKLCEIAINSVKIIQGDIKVTKNFNDTLAGYIFFYSIYDKMLIKEKQIGVNSAHFHAMTYRQVSSDLTRRFRKLGPTRLAIRTFVNKF